MVDIKELLEKGFVATLYEGQEGIFYVKKCFLEKMPAAKELLNEYDFFDPDMIAITETIPGGYVQFHVPDADFIVGPVLCDSEAGRELLEDAMASEPAEE